MKEWGEVMAKLTKQCYMCKEQFNKSELVDYSSAGATILHSYCPKCLIEKQEKDLFSQKVCQIFGLKAPGAKIWTERKKIKEKYGYTDQVITDCLDYIYNVEKIKKKSETLYFVTPSMVEKMQQWKRGAQKKNNGIIAAYQTKYVEHVVPVKENKNSNKTNWNPEDWLYVE